ncbi:universal stress protein [Aquimarina sp. MMG016]|uniref:universal stress protein n=1 Tax=Aquimarina sp. MMG016 TaxID=2822690 RepID=UPI001B3A0581|nr:universal stress protein [Aquimarina sp. MMG016]MBQ4820947.1 universal stress protein [Aquimarina sp. MMG016]
MKRILVPTDFSINAYNALYYATRLFKNEPCKFYILNTFDAETHILTSRIDNHKDSSEYQKSLDNCKEKLTEVMHSIVRDTEDFDHSFETISSSKELLESLKETIKNKDINIIVMGTKGATGAKGFFIGSNTANVIQKIKKCPVLAVPDGFDVENSFESTFSEKEHLY